MIPAVNIDAHRDAPDVNLVTCGAQATIPVVAAIAEVTDVPYAEIVSTISAASAGPGTRANIDEFTESTARAIEAVGGAERGKAIIILNPADPPLLMRNAIYADVPGADPDAVIAAVDRVVETVAAYVPGYRLTAPARIDDGVALRAPRGRGRRRLPARIRRQPRHHDQRGGAPGRAARRVPA